MDVLYKNRACNVSIFLLFKTIHSFIRNTENFVIKHIWVHFVISEVYISYDHISLEHNCVKFLNHSFIESVGYNWGLWETYFSHRSKWSPLPFSAKTPAQPWPNSAFFSSVSFKAINFSSTTLSWLTQRKWRKLLAHTEPQRGECKWFWIAKYIPSSKKEFGFYYCCLPMKLF